MIPSHVEKAVKLILGAGGEILSPLPPELKSLLAVYIATMRCVSNDEPSAKDIAGLLVSLAQNAEDKAFLKGDVLFHVDRQEQVEYFHAGVTGFCLVMSPTSGLIWADESMLVPTQNGVTSTAAVESKEDKPARKKQPAA